MKIDIIEKYIQYKEQILLSYADSLYKAYEIHDSKLWKNHAEFIKILKKIIHIYLEKYYLRDTKEINELNEKKLNNKDFKITLSLAVVGDYYGSNFEKIKSENEDSIYILTVILYVITNADKEITFYNKYNITTQNIKNILNKLFSEIIKDKEIKKSPFVVSILANKIKDAEKQEYRFFECLKDNYISFIKYDKANYYAKLKITSKKIHQHSINDINEVIEYFNYMEKFYPIIYENVALSILSLYANNCEVPNILVPITNRFIIFKKNKEKLLKIFSNPYIRLRVLLSINYNEYIEGYEIYKELEELGFNVAIYIDNTVKNINCKLIKNIVYIKNQKNNDIEKKLERNNLKYILIKDENEINISKLLNTNTEGLK